MYIEIIQIVITIAATKSYRWTEHFKLSTMEDIVELIGSILNVEGGPGPGFWPPPFFPAQSNILK